MTTTISSTGRLSSKEEHHTFRLDNPVVYEKMPNSRTTGGKLDRSVCFSDKVSVEFVPGFTN
jgi:hypothetical protein